MKRIVLACMFTVYASAGLAQNAKPKAMPKSDVQRLLEKSFQGAVRVADVSNSAIYHVSFVNDKKNRRVDVWVKLFDAGGVTAIKWDDGRKPSCELHLIDARGDGRVSEINGTCDKPHPLWSEPYDKHLLYERALKAVLASR